MMFSNSCLLLVAFVAALAGGCDAFVMPTTPKKSGCKAFSPEKATTTSLYMGILNRFRKKEQLKIEPIRPGQTLPEIDVDIVVGNAVPKGEDTTPTATTTIQEVVGGPGTNLLIGMPGAYTPTCSESHMPGYLKSVDRLKKLGVGTIAVVTTNGTL
jgi:hypothetical protein